MKHVTMIGLKKGLFCSRPNGALDADLQFSLNRSIKHQSCSVA
jgi:hypothetical protein